MTEPEVTEIKPPQVLREQVRREHDAALTPRTLLTGLPADIDRAQLAELLKPETLRRNADALPVLAAFQEFLDVERRRTRGRMLALTLLFVLVLVIGGGIAGILGITTYRKTNQQTQAVQADLDALRAQMGINQQTFGTISNLASHASRLESTWDRKLNDLASDQDGLNLQLAGLNTNLAGLHSTIAQLQNKNAQLHSRIERSASDWQALTGRVDRMMARLNRAPAQPPAAPPIHRTSEPVAESDRTPRQPPPTPARHNSLVLAIIPQDEPRAVDWRLPLPFSTPE